MLKRNKSILFLGIAGIAGLFVASFMLSRASAPQEIIGTGTFTLPPSTSLYIPPELGDAYRNSQFGFSFSVPEGFAVRETSLSENLTITVENTTGDGIQIIISPFDPEAREISEAMVRADIPDMTLSDVQIIEIGTEHRGVAFLSDNEAFGGASREVWFPFRGNLYQISTYARLDSLLQTIFSTWEFN